MSQKTNGWVYSLSGFDLSETFLRWAKSTHLIQSLEETFSPIDLQLLHEGIRPALKNESDAYFREVTLLHKSTPLVFARTCASLPLYFAFQKTFDSLNEKPLGKTFLYTNSDFTRSAFEYRLLTDQSSLPKNIQTSTPLFARRSFFEIRINERPEQLLLEEVFLTF